MRAPILKLTAEISHICRRNIGVFAPALQKAADPIQQLFVDALRDYKSKTSGKKMFEPSPELEAELKSEVDRVYKQFNLKPGEDLSKFPTFNFKEKPYDDFDLKKK